MSSDIVVMLIMMEHDGYDDVKMTIMFLINWLWLLLFV